MITTQSLTLPAPGNSTVSAEVVRSENPRCVFTLAHGAGAGMNHDFMVKLAHKLAEKNIATLRFNFPFTENKKGRPDVPAVAHAVIETAIVKAKELFSNTPLFVSGKSFGGRMSSQLLAQKSEISVRGLVFFGFPLHPPKKPSTERAAHLKAIQKPMLFLQGTRDELAHWNLIQEVCQELPTATLHEIVGADHAFKAGKKDTMSMLVEATEEWVARLI